MSLEEFPSRALRNPQGQPTQEKGLERREEKRVNASPRASLSAQTSARAQACDPVQIHRLSEAGFRRRG